MKSILSYLICFYSIALMSQSMMKIKTASPDINMYEVVGMSSVGNLGPAPGSKICAINCTNTINNQNEIMLLPFFSETDIANSFIISQKDGSLHINKVLHTSADEIFFLGTYNGNGADNIMVLGVLSLKLKSLKYIKAVTMTSDPGFVLKPLDAIYANNQFYILAESVVNYLGNFNKKIVLINFDGNNILWSAMYNANAPIHSESPRSLALTPDGNLCIGGTIKRANDYVSRMLLAQFDLQGNPLGMKAVELMSADGFTNHQFGWTHVQSLGVNIHLFSQAVIGNSEPGTVLVTMFDNSLNLRTWRNYTAPIRVESANIEGTFFLFGGQAPIESGEEGFALMKVNSSNAIVEQFKNYKPQLKNTQPISSSSSEYDRLNNSIWTMVKPNGSSENYLVLLENPAVLDHRCADDLISSVAKDPMLVSDVAINMKAIQLSISDIDGTVSELGITATEICNVTSTDDVLDLTIHLYPNPANHIINIKSYEPIEALSIYNSFGALVDHKKVGSTKYQFDANLTPGVYIIHLNLGNGSTQVKKLTIN
jgi:hypothetical protein